MLSRRFYLRLKSIARFFLRRLPIKLRTTVQSWRSRGSMIHGARAYVHPSVHVLGCANVRIGANSCVSEGSWLNVNHRDPGCIGIDIGRSCFIGKNNFLTSGRLISIGAFTLTTIDCKFIGSSHVIDDPRIPCLFSGTTNTDEIHIGVGCFVGAGATVLGHVRIGHGSVVAANSMVMKDVPPFSLVVGNPARVVKRYSFSRNQWLDLSSFSDDDELVAPTEQMHLKNLMEKYAHVDMPWIAAARSMGNL